MIPAEGDSITKPIQSGFTKLLQHITLPVYLSMWIVACRNYCLLCKYLTQDEEMIAHFFSYSSCPCLSHHHHHLMPVMISLNQTTIYSEGHDRSTSMQWCNVVRADILAPFLNKQTRTWNMLRVDWGNLKLMPAMPFSWIPRQHHNRIGLIVAATAARRL